MNTAVAYQISLTRARVLEVGELKTTALRDGF